MPRLLVLSNPRSGSTLLTELLNCHPEIHLEEELLNDEVNIEGDPLIYVEDQLSLHSETFVGFKVFPEQIYQRGLNFTTLVRHIGATQVIVLWREGLLETLVSRRIADKTGIWYSTGDNCQTKSLERIQINPEDLNAYTKETTEDWNKIGDQWPTGISPIYIKFEDLISNPMEQVRIILSRLACPAEKFIASTPSKRQNPGKLEEKVDNFYDLPKDLRNSKLDVKEIFSKKQVESKESVLLQLDPDTLPYAPNKEPCIPPSGWRYRVAEPFMTSDLKQNVYDAVESGSISSAGFWPRLMSSKLKKLFQVPVAQPCCNGFTALMLAMQCADIGEGDEVIVPSMTMVAVPNAVYFLRGRPVFADCAKGNYNPGWEEILAVAGEKTKAIILTHTYGVPSPDLEKIVEECRKRGWWLIEDISEAVGVKVETEDGSTKLLGTFGHFACASMYVNKMIHAGDGGFVIAKDPKFGIRLTSIVNHGFTPAYHFVHFEPAINAKINGVGAAMACGCIDEIQRVMEHRTSTANLYREGLASLPVKLMPICGTFDTPWVFGLVCESKQRRTELRAYLASKGIETRDFFFALHLQPAFYKKGLGKLDQPRLPICEELGSTGFYLPTHSNLDNADVNYITSCVKIFFRQNGQNEGNAIMEMGEDVQDPIAPSRKTNLAVQINPGTFRVGIREFNDSGSLKQTEFRGHVYIEAVKLGLEAEEVLMHERWDEKSELLLRIKECIAEANEMEIGTDMEKYFQPYVEYFESQLNFEQHTTRAWLHEDINLTLKDYSLDLANLLQQIPTTSDPETLQLLLHIIRETRPETIWEIGCWMGHTSFMMAALGDALKIRQKIFACDAFKWQEWMGRFVPDGMQMQPGQSFLKHFEKFTKKFSSSIQPVTWPYDITSLPPALLNQKPDLIFLDITQEEDELEYIWGIMKGNLSPNKTIILFNGLSYKSIPFFTRHAKELVALAKPNTMAKAFKYCDKNTESKIETPEISMQLDKKLNFQSDPGWTHHHKNLFCLSIALLREKYHDPSATVMFSPAIEEKMCDEPELFINNPWIGIAHSVPKYPELFYTPDLSRLCSPRYAKLMQNCRGLFTLTQHQAEFLKQNLPKEYTFPIQHLKYPVEEIDSYGSSEVPELWAKEERINLILVGSFARDFKLFFDVPVPKNLRKVLVTGDEGTLEAAKRAPSDVTILSRLDSEEYEQKLKKSLVFLSLKYDGAANTIILECIARNVPIVAPRMSSCTEYLGTNYPLLYDPEEPKLESLLTLENIKAAIDYLKSMDKSDLQPEKMMQSFEQGAVLLSVPPEPHLNKMNSTSNLGTNSMSRFNSYDVTICICSYKRTHHLPQILKALWKNQDFKGSYQLIIWNNNEARSGTVREICGKYIQESNNEKSLELVNSSENHFCSVRFAMPQLMKSDSLLICDDDIIPGPNFISFFLQAHLKHPKDVLCVRGHVFLPHELDLANPRSLWDEYDSLRFKNDDVPEQFIHFVHADACLIPKAALREIASVEMPDPTFTLVDDYWMSFILNHRFNRKLRKISVAGLDQNPINRTEDSDQVGLALHTRPEVLDARLRLYVYHMLQQWPSWDDNSTAVSLNAEEIENLKAIKLKFWENPKIGYNVSSKITPDDVRDLCRIGVKTVRIGSVGIGGQSDFDLCGLLTDPEEEVKRLERTVTLLKENGIDVVLTLDRRLVSAETWQFIATKLGPYTNVVGYDLINEPFTQLEVEMHWSEVQEKVDDGIKEINNRYKELIKSIRKVDDVTPIIIEPTFWAQCHAIKKLELNELKKMDSNLILSLHFYEPMLLTQRSRNKRRFQFPSKVPVFDNIRYSEEIEVNVDFINDKIQEIKAWGDDNGLKVFIGEFGICRDICGAEGYLGAIIGACKKMGISGYIFSFRDGEWEAMDYELGPDASNVQVHIACEENLEHLVDNNVLMKEILNGVNCS